MVYPNVVLFYIHKFNLKRGITSTYSSLVLWFKTEFWKEHVWVLGQVGLFLVKRLILIKRKLALDAAVCHRSVTAGWECHRLLQCKGTLNEHLKIYAILMLLCVIDNKPQLVWMSTLNVFPQVQTTSLGWCTYLLADAEEVLWAACIVIYCLVL